MLVWLSEYLSQYYSPMSVFQYLTLRGILAVLTALIISWVFGPAVIRRLNYLQIGQAIRSDGPKSHLAKAGTPTMGGALILLAMFVSTLLWADLDNRYVWIVLAVTVAFGMIGFADDYAKVKKQNTKGISSKLRFILGLIVARRSDHCDSPFFVIKKSRCISKYFLIQGFAWFKKNWFVFACEFN